MANLSGVFRIGRDAEVRTTPNGEAVCNLSLAYSYGRKGEDGTRPTQWIDASLWGKRASSLSEYLVKGQMVYAVINDPHTEEFKKKDGSTSIKVSGSVGEIELLGGNTPRKPPVVEKKEPELKHDFGDLGDDIPF